MRRDLLCGVLLLGVFESAGAQSDAVGTAVDALRRGDVATAESTLRAEVRAHPQDPDALGVLAVVLDQQRKYAESDELYRRAVSLTPRSVPLLNNYGNHLMSLSKFESARDMFLKVIALAPGQANATLQLARLALREKAPAKALGYLDRLPAAAQSQPDAGLMRMQALFGLKRERDAQEFLARLSDAAGNDAAAQYRLGTALAAAGEYELAEQHLGRASQLSPDNFDVLYALGLAASHAGHNDRARDVLQSAVRRQPGNVDALYDLAAVDAALGQRETALELLANAARLAPERGDVQQLLARTSADLGYFGDAIAAWDRYLKLVPRDEVARRERAFVLSAMDEDTRSAVTDLKRFVTLHPADAVGHYELGLAEASAAPEAALSEFERALALQPHLTAARVARGLVHMKAGNYLLALPDLEAAAREEPENAVVLDRLGQIYMALERSAEAVPVLRRAADLAPREPKTLMHLGRALMNDGHEDEARQVLARFRELGPDQSARFHPAGLVDFLSLSSQERLARYRAGVERTVRSRPNDVEAQARYLKLLLADDEKPAAEAVARRILELGPSAALLSETGSALLSAGQYALAADFLKRAADGKAPASVGIDLALATLKAVSPDAGLEQLERIPADQRTGDYLLARALILDAAGRTAEAAQSFKHAVVGNPTRSDLLRQAAAACIAGRRAADALQLLDHAPAIRDDPELRLLRAIALEALGRTQDALQALDDAGRRWPDWSEVYVARAIIAAWSGAQDRARTLLQTAATLGDAHAHQRFERAVDSASGSPPFAERGLRLCQALSL